MRTVLGTLRDLADSGLRLALRDGRPIVDAPLGLLSPEDRRALSQECDAICDTLGELFDAYNDRLARVHCTEADLRAAGPEDRRRYLARFQAAIESVAGATAALLAVAYSPTRKELLEGFESRKEARE